jgi:hypothetical protein
MANFGYESIGPSWRNISSVNGFAGTVFTLAEAGTISSITCYMGQDSGSGDYLFAIYKADETLVGVTTPAAITNAYDWRTQNLSTPYSAAAGDYVLGVWTTGTAVFSKYDTTVNVHWTDTTPGTWSTLNNPFDGSTAATGKISIYATYAAGGGATNVVYMTFES